MNVPSYSIPVMNYGQLLPFIVVALTGVVGLILEMIRPKRRNDAIVSVTLGGLILALGTIAAQLGNRYVEAGGGMVHVDNLALIAQFAIVAGTGLTVLFSDSYLRQKGIPYGEFYPLLVWSALGGMIMVSTQNLLLAFVGLEILSVALYVLAGLSRDEERSQESALKYFLLGAFASGFFLFGIALTFGATGSLSLLDLRTALASYDSVRPLATMGLAFLLIGLGFKASLAPFHMWTPDVYEGAPTNVSAFMGAISKVAAVATLTRVLVACTALQNVWGPALTVIAIVTMIWGNVMAQRQQNVKRILAYSGVAQAGYMLVGVMAYAKSPDTITSQAVAYYLLGYTLMTIGSFAVVALLASRGRDTTNLSDLRGLGRDVPLAGFALVVFMAGLIGLPPTGGVIAKFLVFRDALSADLAPLAWIMAINSIFSLKYYLAIAGAVMRPADDAIPARPIRMEVGAMFSTLACAAGLFAIFFFFEPIANYLNLR